MDSYEVFRTIIEKYIGAHANFVGHPICVSQHSLATYISIFIWYSYALTSVYTIFTASLEEAILNVYLCLFATQGIVKSFVTLTRVTERKSAIDFLSNLYKSNKFNIENRHILSKCIRWNLLIAKLLNVVFFATASSCVCIPLALFLITGRMEPILPSHIPFVPSYQLWGYAIHCLYFISVAVSAYCGTVAIEVLLLTTTMHIWPMYKILEKAIIGLNQATGSFRKEAVRNSTWLHRRVRNIVLMHREINFYLREMARVNYPIFSNELYTDQWSLIILIYVIIVLKWPPAMLLFLCMLTKLLLYCTFGTAVEILNDRIYSSLLNIDCVTLPSSGQKLILFVILQAQHPASFSAGLVPLNMMTFMKVVKTIYSFTMVLLEVA